MVIVFSSKNEESECIYLLVAPDKANYYRVLFPALHPIYGPDLHVFTVDWAQYGREERDLCLVPEPS